jgi:hypothetical protein
MSDKKNVSIPKAVEEDMNKPADKVLKEKASSDGEGKEGPEDPDGGGQKEEGKSKESTGGVGDEEAGESTEMDDDKASVSEAPNMAIEESK